MKKRTTVLLVTFYLLFSTFHSSGQNVGINSTGATPDNSALLDLSASDKGFLITRADTANIPTPAFGLMTLAPLDSCLYLFNGTAWMGMGGGGSNCTCNCAAAPPSASFPCGGTVIPIVDVTNPTTGETWMDRNLGASQVATSSTDAAAYGDLYQWGRCSDGHEKRTSGTTSTLSVLDTPGHGDFITTSGGTNDWRSPQNNSLWQGVAGINNPCPTGYRIPTEPELDAERVSWASNDAAGAFASPLKLSAGGYRLGVGFLSSVATRGYYWSSTFGPTTAIYLEFGSSFAFMNSANRSNGFSVRCIKD
jgi:uncharacterized protein (TIGR02145 family)